MTILTTAATPTALAATAEGTLLFERNDERWHIRLYRAADGTTIVERLRGTRCKPITWRSDRTPEQWVGVQAKPELYVKVAE